MKTKEKIDVAASFMKKELITLVILEVLVLLVEYMIRIGSLSLDLMGTAFIFGNDLILGIGFWSFGVNYYSKMKNLKNVAGLGEKDAQKLTFEFALGVCVLFTIIDTMPLSFVNVTCPKISAFRALYMLLKTGPAPLSIPVLFVEEFLYFALALLVGYGLGALWEKIGTIKLLAGSLAIAILIEGICLVMGSSLDKNGRGIANLAQTYAIMHTASKGDVMKYMKTIDKETMDPFFEQIKIKDNYFAFPIREGDIPERNKADWGRNISAGVNGEAVKVDYMFYANVVHSGTASAENQYVNGIEIWPWLGMNVSFGNGLKSTSSKDEFFAVLGESEPFVYKYPNSENKVMETYLYTDGEGRYMRISYYYDAGGNSDLPMNIAIGDDLQLVLFGTT